MQLTISEEGGLHPEELAKKNPPLILWPQAKYLPTEILINVFQHFNEHTQWRPHQRRDLGGGNGRQNLKSNLLPLMLSCRRFKQLLEPILYQRISISFNTLQGQISRRKLLQILQKRPHLFQFIQELDFEFNSGSNAFIGVSGRSRGDSEEEDILAASSFLQKVNPKILYLQGEWELDVDPRLCQALSRFQLEKLQLSESWGQFFFCYLQSRTFSKLKELRLASCSYGLFSDRIDNPYALPTIIYTVPEHSWIGVENLLAGGGNINADYLYHVCRFIRTLKSFRLQHVSNEWRSDSYCRTIFQKVLNLHRDTLEVIELPIIFGFDNKIPYLADFTSLKYLHLSWDNLVIDTPYNAMENIAAPLLEHLTLDMDHGDQQIHGTGNFDEVEARWLTDFVAYRPPGSCLRHFHIVFVWYSDRCEYYWSSEEPDNKPWPNSQLKSLKPLLALKGVSLSWNEPPLSEEQWMDKLDEIKHRYDDCEISETDSENNSEDEDKDEIDILSRLDGKKPEDGSSQRCIEHYFSRKRSYSLQFQGD